MKVYLGLLVLFFCVTASSSVFSQVYLGAVFGASQPNSSEPDGTLPELEGDSAYRVFLGNRLSSSFAVEAGYSNFGIYEVEDIDSVGFEENTLALTGVDASVLGKLPLGKHLSLYGRLGVFYWEAQRTTLDGNTGIRETVIADELDYVVGAGIEIHPLNHFGLMFETNSFNTDKVSHLVYGVGLYYHF